MVPTQAEENLKYCDQLVRDKDPDRWYALGYAPKAMRAPLMALYAWKIELTQLVYQVKTPPLGEIRLQWWREALGEALGRAPVRAHPVVQAMAQLCEQNLSVSFKDKFEADIGRAIDAKARLFYEAPFENVDDLWVWAKESDGVFDGIAGSLIGTVKEGAVGGHDIDWQKGEDLIDACALLTLARDGARLAPNLAPEEISQFALGRWDEIRSDFKNVPGSLMGVCLPYRLLSHYAAQKPTATLALRRQWVYFASVLTGSL